MILPQNEAFLNKNSLFVYVRAVKPRPKIKKSHLIGTPVNNGLIRSD